MISAIRKRVLLFLVLVLCVSASICVTFGARSSYSARAADTNEDFVYLSDLAYDPAQSSVGWREILSDKTVNDTKITVKIEGAWYAFDKGIFSHAAATILYDISGYAYNYFTAYTGLDKLITKKSNGVKFFVYTSTDGTNWTLKTSENPTVLGIAAEAEFLTVDIRGARYLKLVVDPNGYNGADYAVWADAKLTNDLSGGGDVKPLSYYDEQIKAKGSSAVESDESLELLVLQREFVRRVGQYALKRFVGEGEDNKTMLRWLLNDVDNLREFVLGGDPMQGSYYNALTVLSDLYRNYKTDLDNTTVLHNRYAPQRTYGELYRTMMFSVALTHDGTVGSWMQKERKENQSDPLRRYAIYRYMHATDRFTATAEYETKSMFESLTVEEMRWIMYNIIDDESILWLNDYVQTKINADPEHAANWHAPHRYIAYTNPNYRNPVYYAEENREYFNELFAVDDREHSGQKIGMWDTSYTVPGGTDHATYTMTITRGTDTDQVLKVWMNFRNKFNTGSVCGGISKSGTNIRSVRGIPSTVIGQPGHAAILCYGKNSEGKGYWGIDNNVGGWTVATKGERHLLGWGNASWQRTHPTVVYFHLAQDALNDYDAYRKAEENVMTARTYQGDAAKQEALCERALEIQPINIDAWYGLIEAYKANSRKTEQNYYDLAKRVADTMVGYPLPMYNILNLIKPKLVTTEFVYAYTLLEHQSLTASSLLPNTATDKTLLPSVARVEAQYLLGNVDTSVADFSFDGEHAGCIVLSSRFDETGLRWKYSLDGKKTWKETFFTAEEPHVYPLTEEELASVTEENDIYVGIVGESVSEENYYRIDISSKPSLPQNLYGNDYENRIVGSTDNLEWRYAGSTAWTPYAETAPDCTGNKTVEVRVKAAGDNPPSDIGTFAFTEDTDTRTRKYVPVSHLTIEGYSTQSTDPKRPYYAPNAIDGNIHTFWHTDFSENVLATGNTPYLIIKLDTPRYVSGLDFVQTQYSTAINIFAKSVRVFVGEDTNTWTEAGRLENIEAMDYLKSVSFDQSVYGRYIKLEMETYGIFADVAMINIYEEVAETDDPNGGNTTDTPNGGNTADTPNGGGNGNTAVKVIVPVVCVAVAASAAAATFVLLKRKKAKRG